MYVYMFFNALIFNMLQKAVFYTLKGGLLRCDMRQIGTRYAAYWNAICGILENGRCAFLRGFILYCRQVVVFLH